MKRETATSALPGESDAKHLSDSNAEKLSDSDAEKWLNSSLSLAGLCFGIGVLDPQEVLRYMDVSFRYNAPSEPPVRILPAALAADIVNPK